MDTFAHNAPLVEGKYKKVEIILCILQDLNIMFYTTNVLLVLLLLILNPFYVDTDLKKKLA